MDIKLPKKFEERLRGQLGDADFDKFQDAFSNLPAVSLRVNPLKPTDQFEEEKDVPWCPGGKYLPKRPLFAKDPLIFAGGYYVQEASSMFLSEALRQHAPLDEDIRVLDLCAAPGGKSTLIASLLSENSMLVSNELMPKRLPALQENITRWGNSNSFITHNEASHFLPLKDFFDVIVVDAPCSGEGMFRKDPKAVEMWSPGLINTCSNIQEDILGDIIQCLKPGGILVYSTCTFAPQENEEKLQWLAESGAVEPLRMELQEDWNVTELKVDTVDNDYFGYRFIFHKTRGEGLFLSVFRKHGNRQAAQKPKLSKKRLKNLKAENRKYIGKYADWVKDHEKYEYVIEDDAVWAVPVEVFDSYRMLQTAVNVKNKGIELGRMIKDKLQPAHHLAMSKIFSDKIPVFDLNYEDAILYLRKQELKIDTNGKKGWALVRYGQHILGWIKILPNRINNYYPSEMRLRKEF
ncbi:methyltransferase RsmF C-terminal domain-like protein [Sediminitomix flava]|uniref:16S rRNA C967 or C1407 C5-methylase (RsmB/RsmF family) n=1 Tax=Sediminitomix flava TaxID=379075 RepID=A0A315ZIZ4_SEDFL|nr:hypothetical protein [Sediminitomix flava]PWJ44664.1 16S rRNA C967 or C1407 C5-methylase (RsmB/RsmF family) [Sediminitomix flava]